MTTTATTMRKILVTGGNGQLGEAIRRAAEGSANSYTFATIDELDICNRANVERYITENKIDTIINCAAYTDVEGAEDNDDIAESVNCNGVLILASLCLNHNIKFIHISTDYVFGGDKLRRIPYSEEDDISPINKYGLSKARGEVVAIKFNGIVIRTSWLYAPWGKNFVLTMLRLGKEHDKISVVDDQRGTPTSALGLARAIVLMVESGAMETMHGIYHYTDGGECTWHNFACEIMREAGLACRVEPCTTAERNMRAARPAYSVLNTARMKTIEGIAIAPWQERLREVISLINK